MQFDHLCKEKLTFDTIELYAEPIVLFTDVSCIIAKSCMPKTKANRRNADDYSHMFNHYRIN